MPIELTTKKQNTTKDPELIKQELMRKEAAISLALRTHTGLAKLAAALANPVRKYLDYVPIYRRIAVTDGGKAIWIVVGFRWLDKRIAVYYDRSGKCSLF